MRRAWQGLPVTELHSPDGACAVVADHGAHVLSWTPAGDAASEALFLSAATGGGDGVAIRGGVPVIFPQFAERGPGRRHGFARIRPWRQIFAGIEEGVAVARYCLTDGDLQPGDLPSGEAIHGPGRFLLEYSVAVHGAELHLALTVSNTDSRAWGFMAALHTYLAVTDVAQVALRGLRGLRYLDQTAAGAEVIQQVETLTISGEVDRIYADVNAPLELVDGDRCISLNQTGFADAIVWNPGTIKDAALSDLMPGDGHRFLCVEAGTVLQPVTLAPGASWQASQTMRVC